MPSGNLRVERTGPGGVVARVTLDRPEVHNAFNAALMAELRTTFASLAREGPMQLRAVILAGAIGISLGLVAGYFGGLVNAVLMRGMNERDALPLLDFCLEHGRR